MSRRSTERYAKSPPRQGPKARRGAARKFASNLPSDDDEDLGGNTQCQFFSESDSESDSIENSKETEEDEEKEEEDEMQGQEDFVEEQMEVDNFAQELGLSAVRINILLNTKQFKPTTI